MENVKGMLSSHIAGRRLFPRILQDLTSPTPGKGHDGRRTPPEYRLYSLVNGCSFRRSQNPESIRPEQFIIQAEYYGIPQTRHRVILFGLREDLANQLDRSRRPFRAPPVGWPDRRGRLLSVSARQVLAGLPPLRSGLSHGSRPPIRPVTWPDPCCTLASAFAPMIEDPELRTAFEQAALRAAASVHPSGGRSVAATKAGDLNTLPAELATWYRGIDPPLVLNHETRNHMPEDLARYLFCAVYAQLKGASPKAAQFPAALAPRHQNWETGKLSDRFRVQVADQPATTVMSHMAKDGHYCIHYDPAQCRSLTVREAARLQTFPDSYFFEGYRTQQYTQVGNAVPPFLARQIADVVWKLLRQVVMERPDMTDIVDQATRSRMMSCIRNRDTVPEMAVRRELYGLGIRYRLYNGKLPGQTRHCHWSVAHRDFRPRLLLASTSGMPAGLYAEIQCRVLAAQAARQCGAGCSQSGQVSGTGLADTHHLGV